MRCDCNNDYIQSIFCAGISFQQTVYTVSEADQSVTVCLISLELVPELITIHLTTTALTATGIKLLYLCVFMPT